MSCVTNTSPHEALRPGWGTCLLMLMLMGVAANFKGFQDKAAGVCMNLPKCAPVFKKENMAGPATPAASYRMISIPEAQETVLRHALPLPPQRLGLDSAVGRVLAQDVLAPEPLPPFPGIHQGMQFSKACNGMGKPKRLAEAPALHKPVATQDGYAVRSSDGPGEYTVEFEALAGTAPGRLSAGLVAYIGTGISTFMSFIKRSPCAALLLVPESCSISRWSASRGRRRGGADREHGAAARQRPAGGNAFA